MKRLFNDNGTYNELGNKIALDTYKVIKDMFSKYPDIDLRDLSYVIEHSASDAGIRNIFELGIAARKKQIDISPIV